MKTFAENPEKNYYTIALKVSLTDFCMELDNPLVILFDETAAAPTSRASPRNTMTVK